MEFAKNHEIKHPNSKICTPVSDINKDNALFSREKIHAIGPRPYMIGSNQLLFLFSLTLSVREIKLTLGIRP